MRILFMGTPLFAKEILQHLLSFNFLEIVGVVCQPDRKVGRKQLIITSEIKQIAISKKLRLYQPENINQITEELIKLKPDLIITCAYGQFLGTKVLNIAPKGCLNIHASLLPKLRGGAPIQWAIIKRYPFTGISLMQTILKMDAGPIFVQEKIAIAEDDTTDSLTWKLIALAKTMLSKYLSDILKGEIIPYAQNENEVAYALNIKREDEKINWNQDVQAVAAQIKGLFSQPLAYTIYEQKIYKIAQTKIYDLNKKIASPGTIIAFLPEGIEVQAKNGSLLIVRLQPESKRLMDVQSFYQGQHNLKIGGHFS